MSGGDLQRALAQARAVRGTTAPNPAVGAVLIKDGVEIGSGGTQPAGGLHAETQALQDCRARGNDPRGATLYVTLEPCCHVGKQPPCTDAIQRAGIARVVVGVLDPNVQMRGRSVALLREAGVEVEVHDDAGCAEQILGFARAITRGLPEVSLKAATSADGRIATAEGRSQWITGEEARAVGQQLRAEHDGILVGIGTVLADDPRLTCRLPGATSPVPIVLDSQLRFPAGCALDRPETLVITGSDADTDLNATVIRLPLAQGRVPIEAALRQVVERGIHRVLVEGGGEVARSLLDAGLVDHLHQFVAGKLIPGGRGFVGGPPVEALDRYHLKLAESRSVGDDLYLRWRFEHAVKPDWA